MPAMRYAQLESLGVVDDGEATIRLALVECLIAAGDALAAQEILDKAAKRIVTSAEAIEDPAIRESFLTASPNTAASWNSRTNWPLRRLTETRNAARGRRSEAVSRRD